MEGSASPTIDQPDGQPAVVDAEGISSSQGPSKNGSSGSDDASGVEEGFMVRE